MIVRDVAELLAETIVDELDRFSRAACRTTSEPRRKETHEDPGHPEDGARRDRGTRGGFRREVAGQRIPSADHQRERQPRARAGPTIEGAPRRHGDGAGARRPEIDEVLFTAVAKGVDRAVKITGVDRGSDDAKSGVGPRPGAPGGAERAPADLILTGCQAIDDLDGQVAPLLTQALKLPYLGLVTKVTSRRRPGAGDGHREFAGGVRGEFDVADARGAGYTGGRKTAALCPVAKVRAVMKSAQIETVAASAPAQAPIARDVSR